MSRARHRSTAVFAGVVVFVMLGASFAAVPLYRLFCAATGFGGTTQVAHSAPATRGARTLTVRFDANVTAGLPWRLEPEQASISARTGETKTVFFRVTNLSNAPTTGIAAYNVSPDQAGAWFNKIACFCFSEQTLGPRETAEWPVVFFLDPSLETDETMAQVGGVTLSYTVYAPKGGPKPAAEVTDTRRKS